MAKKEWEEQKYFNLFTGVTMLDVYLKNGGTDMEHVKKIINEMLNQNNELNGGA